MNCFNADFFFNVGVSLALAILTEPSALVFDVNQKHASATILDFNVSQVCGDFESDFVGKGQLSAVQG